MGSVPHLNKGVPATPRDGAPIELVGLQYSVISFLHDISDKGLFPYKGVSQMSFNDWASKIRSNFEPRFYVEIDPSKDS